MDMMLSLTLGRLSQKMVWERPCLLRTKEDLKVLKSSVNNPAFLWPAAAQAVHGRDHSRRIIWNLCSGAISRSLPLLPAGAGCWCALQVLVASLLPLRLCCFGFVGHGGKSQHPTRAEVLCSTVVWHASSSCPRQSRACPAREGSLPLNSVLGNSWWMSLDVTFSPRLVHLCSAEVTPFPLCPAPKCCRTLCWAALAGELVG